MRFSVSNENGSGCEYFNKDEFMEEISMMIDDCIENGGTYFDVEVDSDASCYYYDKEE